MSRILGRVNDVLQISKELQKINQKYKKDNAISSWEEIEEIKDNLSLYLPDIAIDFLNKDKISILKSPFRIYTFTNVPEYEDETRYIRFPSEKPKQEFEREYAFYLGLLLSSYQKDTEEEMFEIGNEYDDLLPLLLEYLYLNKTGSEEKFSLKHLNFLKKYTVSFESSYKKYIKFNEFHNYAETRGLSDKEYDNYLKLSDEEDEIMERVIMDHLVKLSSFDGVLQIKDKDYSLDEYKKLIEELILNKDENRASILYERGIESYGYKRLRKEIDKYKKR